MGVNRTRWQCRNEQRERDAEPALHGEDPAHPTNTQDGEPPTGCQDQPSSSPLMISSCGTGSSSLSGSWPGAGISIQRCTASAPA